MTYPYQGALRGALSMGAAILVAGCAASTRSVPVTAHPSPAPGVADLELPRITITPAIVPSDGFGVIRISDPGADSIALETVNGVEHLSVRKPVLTIRINGSFGQLRDTASYAVRGRGVLFDVVKRPIKITTCRQRQCREYYHVVTFRLPERNERSVALTAGLSTGFTRRAITGENRSVLLREALNNSLWSMQAEVATHGLNARLQGYYNGGEQGGSLDLSQTFKPVTTDVMGYGIALHVAARRIDWLRDGFGSELRSGSAYQASIGPSFMLKGLTASSQFGLYTDGNETLQVLSTFVSLNGNLTDVRGPVSLTLEKTFAFGGDPILPRRRDGTDRMMIGVQLAPSLALRVGMNSRHSAWPVTGTNADIQVSELYYSIGAQYTLSW